MSSFKLILTLIGFLVISSAIAEKRILRKRQIYREQVLPHAGGKIPDTAFETDRLFLNRLQKDGIAIPDGIILEQRNPQVHQYYNKANRPVFKVALSSDGRYTPLEGRYIFDTPPSVETTYLYPQIHGYPEQTQNIVPSYPIYSQFKLHNPLLNQPKFQPKKKAYYYLNPFTKTTVKEKTFKPSTKINIINDPFGSFTFGQFEQDYTTSHLFNEFDHLFNGFTFRNSRSSNPVKNRYEKKSSKRVLTN